MWSKFDDQFYMNPKIASLGRDEQDLYMAGIIYCNGQLTDGFIPFGVIPMLSAWAKIEANAQAIASHLLDAGLWEIATNGYKIHDFLDWNMSKADVLAMKAARSEAGKRGGLKSVAKRQANASASAQAKTKQNSTQSQSQTQEKKRVNEAKPRDPLLDNPAVMAYREVCRLTPNDVQRRDISEKVTDLDLWKTVCTEWMRHGWKPGNIPGMIDAYSVGGIKSNGAQSNVRRRRPMDRD